MFILISVTVLALIFGAILGFASIKLKVKADPIVEKNWCHLTAKPMWAMRLSWLQALCRSDCQWWRYHKMCAWWSPNGSKKLPKSWVLMYLQWMMSLNQKKWLPFINENMCIGCTKCIQACPVDAIIGTNKFMHTIIPDLCTGCELCVAPLPDRLYINDSREKKYR